MERAKSKLIKVDVVKKNLCFVHTETAMIKFYNDDPVASRPGRNSTSVP